VWKKMSLFLAKRLSADSLLHFGTLSSPFYSKLEIKPCGLGSRTGDMEAESYN